MEQSFDTSFIPKNPIFKMEGGPRRSEPIPVVTLISFSIFFAMLITAGVSYIFSEKNLKQVDVLKAQLGKEEENFKPKEIEDLKVVSMGFQKAQDIVQKHTALSPVLGLIEKDTLQSVRYASFNYVKDQKGLYTVRLQGDAQSYGGVLAQAEVFRTDPSILSTSFGNISLNESNGTVGFDVSLVVDPKLLLFESLSVQNIPVPSEYQESTSTLSTP